MNKRYVLNKHKKWLNNNEEGQRPSFFLAELSKAKLNKAKLSKADLRQAKLDGANLRGAKLDGADLSNATYDNDTLWPDDFDHSKEGMIPIE